MGVLTYLYCSEAIHLEIVADLSAELFPLALSRFITRRGKPPRNILDNASQFNKQNHY